MADLRQITDLAELAGKTVRQARDGDDRIALVFDDDRYLVVRATHDRLVVDEPCKDDWERRQLGLISDEEYFRRRTIRTEEGARHRKAYELQELARLKALYEPEGGTP